MIEQAVISVTFDDAPISAVQAGAEVLERHGARGSYYVCAGLDGRPGHMGDYARMADYAELAQRGHEIACHTFSHLDCGKAGSAAIQADVEQNTAALAEIGVQTRHFAYPYGDVSPQAKRVLSSRFSAMRALHPGLVRQGSDLNQLPAVGIEGAGGEAYARHWIDMALDKRAWLILYTHDVREAASDWGCSPHALERLIQHALAGGARLATVGEILTESEHVT